MALAGELEHAAGDGSSAAMTRSVAIERDMLAPETLGFTLAEAKSILAELQATIVADRWPPMKGRSAAAAAAERLGA